MGASYHRGKSDQNVGTPPEFKAAVEKRFGLIDIDLAATKETALSRHEWDKNEAFYFGPDQYSSGWGSDALVIDWRTLWEPVRWLNPPFANIGPWAKKCAECRELRAWTLLLVPYSAGTKWWNDSVRRKAMVFALFPRFAFVGHNQTYPKDLALCAYGYGVSGEDVWFWNQTSDVGAV